MKDLCDMRDSLLWMHDAVSLLVDAIDGDRLSEVKKRYWQIIEHKKDLTWDFEDYIIEYIEEVMRRILSWEQNEGGKE